MKNYLALKLFCCCSFLWFGGNIYAQPIQPMNLTTYPIPFGAQKLKAVDMNNDRKTDLIVMSNAQETGFATYYGNGDETFGLPQSYQKELNFVNFDVADLNKDGYMDLVLSSYWFNGFKTYFGDGNQQFLFRDSYDMGAHATGVTISDIDNDGFQDVIGVTSGSGNPVTLNVFKGDKSGNLQSAGKYPTLLSGNLNSYVVDKNGDQLSDVIISTRNWLALFYQQTNGEFLLKYWPVDMASVAIGDINNDKLPDMALGYTSYDLGSDGDSILVRFGLPDTSFSAKPIKLMTDGLRPGSMYLADLNNDKLPELIINQLNADGNTTDSLYIFRGFGNDGFELQGIYKLPEVIKSFVVADLQNDSFPEIILISDKTLMIMHNSGTILSSGESTDLNTARIYPNPVSNWLFLDLPHEITDIRILDMYGQVRCVSKYVDSLKISIQSLPSGIYIVQGFQKDKLSIARKIIKI
jgi:hypothetical protein